MAKKAQEALRLERLQEAIRLERARARALERNLTYEDEYKKALADGEMDVAYSRVMFLGSGGVGKTCLKRSLMKEPWDPPSMNSTIVSDIHHIRPVGYQWQSLGHDADDQWRVVTEEDEIQEMAELLAVVHDDIGEFKSKMSATQLYHVDDKLSSNADVSQLNVKDLERKYVNSVLSKAIDQAKSIPTSSRITPQPFVHIWDCGGQPVFLEVLPAFLTSRTMFLLIYDASRSFHDRWKSVHTIRGERKEEGEVNMTTLDLMRSWLSNIFILANEGDSIDYPRVLSIGTHKDKVKNHKAKIKELESHFDGMKFRALIDGFYMVDNTTAGKGEDEDGNFAKIRKKIFNFTSDKLIVKTPISWVLYRKVIEIYKANVISLSEAQAIGVACKIPAEVVPKVLLFYHDLGVVLFYPHIRGLHDRVIINPKWFVNALGKVLTLEGLEEYQTRLRNEWKQFCTNGILVQRLYEAAWKDVKDISPKALIELLVYFRLAAKVNIDFKIYGSNITQQYFLPLVLPSYVHQEPLSEYLQRATPLHITFRTEFIPPGFFTRLVTILAETSKCKIRFEKGVYRDRIHIFYGDPSCDDVILMELPHAIQIDVFRCCQGNVSLPPFTDVCQMLMKDLIEISKKVDHCLFASGGNQKSLFKNVQLVCSKCPSGDLHYIRHNDDKQTSDLYISCDKTAEKDEYRLLTKEESHWFPKVDDVLSSVALPPPVAVQQQIAPVDDVFPPTLPPVAVRQQIPPNDDVSPPSLPPVAVRQQIPPVNSVLFFSSFPTAQAQLQMPPLNDLSFPTLPPVAVQQQIPPVISDVSPPTIQPVAVRQQISPTIYDNCNGRKANQLTGIDKEPKLKDLASQLHPVKAQWRAIGVQLDIEDHELESIGKDPTLDDSDKLTKVCQLWMKKRTTEVSWRKILEVIRNPPINNGEVYHRLQIFLGLSNQQ